MQMNQRRRFVLGTSALLALAVVASIGLIYIPYWRPDYWMNKSALEERLKSAAEQGTPVRFSDLAVSDPAGTELANQLSKELEKLVPIPNELLETDSDSDSQRTSLLNYLQQNEKTLASIEALQPLSACRFSFDAETPSPMGTLLPHVDGLNKLLRNYRAKFRLAVEDKNGQAAFESFIDTLECSECLAKDPFFVSQMVRARTGEEALEILLRILEMTDLSEEQFLATDALLQKLEAEFRVKGYIASEAAICFTNLENIAHPLNREHLFSTADLHVDGTISNTALSRVNRWSSWAYKPHLMAQQLWVLDNTSELTKLVDEPGPEATAAWINTIQSIDEFIVQSREEAIASLYPVVAMFRSRAFHYRHRLMLSRIALRLDRYDAQHGAYPHDLAQIVDNALPSLPRNLWTGEAVQYRSEEGKCVLVYSYDNGHEPDTVSITLTK
jgi:hypothetical protein